MLASLINVDKHHRSSDIQVLCPLQINNHTSTHLQCMTNDLSSLYSHLPIALQRICGNVLLPADGGPALIQHILTTDRPLLGVSDASLKDGQSVHAWILSKGDINHIDDPMMRIAGRGPIDGYNADLSSTTGEIQGQAALAIMTSTLLQVQHQPNLMVIFHGDNKGTQNKCAAMFGDKLCDHRQSNQDLYLEYHHHAHDLNKKVEWVKGHQDSGKEWENITDLQHLRLSSAAYMNIWCNRQADIARKSCTFIPDAEVLPTE